MVDTTYGKVSVGNQSDSMPGPGMIAYRQIGPIEFSGPLKEIGVYARTGSAATQIVFAIYELNPSDETQSALLASSGALSNTGTVGQVSWHKATSWPGVNLEAGKSYLIGAGFSSWSGTPYPYLPSYGPDGVYKHSAAGAGFPAVPNPIGIPTYTKTDRDADMYAVVTSATGPLISTVENVKHGGAITITGSNLAGVTSVTLGTHTLSISTQSASQIVCAALDVYATALSYRGYTLTVTGPTGSDTEAVTLVPSDDQQFVIGASVDTTYGLAQEGGTNGDQWATVKALPSGSTVQLLANTNLIISPPARENETAPFWVYTGGSWSASTYTINGSGVTNITPPAYTTQTHEAFVEVSVNLATGWVNANPTGFTATGLPAGLYMQPNGTVIGQVSKAGTASVKVHNGTVESAAFNWVTTASTHTIYGSDVAGTLFDQISYVNDGAVSANATPPALAGYYKIHSARLFGRGLSLTTPARIGVYKRAANRDQSTLVAVSNPVTASPSPDNQWYSFTFPQEVTLEQGQRYILAVSVNYSGSSAAKIPAFSNPGGTEVFVTNPAPGTWPGMVNPIGPALLSSTATVQSIALLLDTAAAPPPTPVAPDYPNLSHEKGKVLVQDLSVGWANATVDGFTVTGLPAGLSMSAFGLVTGTPTTVQTVTTTVSNGGVSDAFQWTITAPVTVAPSYSARTGSVGTSVSADLSIGWQNPVGNFTWSNNVPGLSMSTAGIISGTPTTAGAPAVTVTNNGVTSAPFTWTIAAAPPSPPVYTDRTNDVASTVSVNLGTGWTNAVTGSFSATGLPDGLTMNAQNGVVTGTPLNVQTRSVTVYNQGVASNTFTWTIAEALPTAPVYTSKSSATLTPVNFDLSTGWSLADPNGYTVNKLPAGLSMSPQGIVTGTPTTVQTVTGIIVSNGGVSSAPFQWAVTLGAAIAPVYDNRMAYLGNSVNVNLAAGWLNTDGSAFTITALPAGLTMSAAGIVTGTPTTDQTVVSRVTHRGVQSAAFTWNIDPLPASAALIDAKFNALRGKGYTGAMLDMTLQWLKANGATSNALADAWMEMLLLKTTAPIGRQHNDLWFQLLGQLGYTGALPDRELAFWSAGGSLP